MKTDFEQFDFDSIEGRKEFTKYAYLHYGPVAAKEPFIKCIMEQYFIPGHLSFYDAAAVVEYLYKRLMIRERCHIESVDNEESHEN